MKRYYIVTQLPPQLLCERVVKTDSGYLLYEYEKGIFADSGYAKNLEDLDFMIRARYGFHKSVRLVESFEEAVKMFDTPLPRIIQLSRSEVFCVKEGGVLFNIKWDCADGNLFFKKFEWFLGGEEPANIREALRRLSEYAKRNSKWVVFRHVLKSATAYEVYPE